MSTEYQRSAEERDRRSFFYGWPIRKHRLRRL